MKAPNEIKLDGMTMEDMSDLIGIASTMINVKMKDGTDISEEDEEKIHGIIAEIASSISIAILRHLSGEEPFDEETFQMIKSAKIFAWAGYNKEED